MRRRFAALFLLMILMGALIGCGSGAKSGPNPNVKGGPADDTKSSSTPKLKVSKGSGETVPIVK
jgi:predicted small lipoprotein YifL